MSFFSLSKIDKGPSTNEHLTLRNDGRGGGDMAICDEEGEGVTRSVTPHILIKIKHEKWEEL